MKQILKAAMVSLMLVGAASAASDVRQLVVIPAGVTAVTNAALTPINLQNVQTHNARLVSYMANCVSNMTVTLVMAGAYTNTVLVATTAGAAATTGTVAAIVGTPTVTTTDQFIVSLGGTATNSVASYLYLSMHGD